MRRLLYILPLLTVIVAVAQCGLLEFGIMIQRVTGNNAFRYAFYGCHCGLGGYGRPKDDIDWCCHRHDCCFDVMSAEGCKPMSILYDFDITNGNVTCDILSNSYCARQVCECDREAALCFKQNNHKYSKKHAIYLKHLKCKGLVPECSNYVF
ncbi:basic phospholipase A2 caudoxin-like [Pelobates fuscus]|uniref:basic phospholipase A2 caudoxin-like n=1 Tax=Pelobates fuscus TaxID=191477 RepID=UPI002FE4E770